MARALRQRSRWGVILGLALAAGPASSQEGATGQPVELDKLLKLPSSIDYGIQTRGGLTPGEWRQRFTSLRVDLEREQTTLKEAEEELAEAASGQEAWQIAPALPGVAAAASADGPIDYSLRQEINRARAEIDRIERQLKELEIEANLAGVPEEWRS